MNHRKLVRSIPILIVLAVTTTAPATAETVSEIIDEAETTMVQACIDDLLRSTRADERLNAEDVTGCYNKAGLTDFDNTESIKDAKAKAKIAKYEAKAIRRLRRAETDAHDHFYGCGHYRYSPHRSRMIVGLGLAPTPRTIAARARFNAVFNR